MLKRKMYQFLLDWKNNKGKECLLIKGARQIGKTFIVEEFGKNEYKSFIDINFLKTPGLKGIFDGDLTADEIYKRMSAYLPGIKLVKGGTLVFLDEIQKCANARTALKFLAEQVCLSMEVHPHLSLILLPYVIHQKVPLFLLLFYVPL